MTRILRVIWDLQNKLVPFEKLFRDIYQMSYISFGQHRINSSELLTAGNWERTKSQHIVTQGFELSEDKPLNIEHQFVFRDYAGSSGIDPDLVLSILWKLASESLSRTVTINREVITELEESIPIQNWKIGSWIET